ncbi:MAG: hypothetical protein OEZ29_00180 [Candidatus Bathyarchaeota archaeon]|nr:hypothetical protein [Candidatus Bathyarchaeota archaeon]MDH5778995.1 hypothetical protein [Candidatus Bathyarchaeota archaeon]
MPLTETVRFKVVVQKNRRIQIPRLVRWRFKLDPGEVFAVTVAPVGAFADERFYAKMSGDGRITVPKLQANILTTKLDEKTLEGYAVEVRLSPIHAEKEDE